MRVTRLSPIAPWATLPDPLLHGVDSISVSLMDGERRVESNVGWYLPELGSVCAGVRSECGHKVFLVYFARLIRSMRRPW